MKILYTLTLIFILLIIFAFLNLSDRYSKDPKTPPAVSQETMKGTPESSGPSAPSEANQAKEISGTDSAEKIDFESVSGEYTKDLIAANSSTKEEVQQEEPKASEILQNNEDEKTPDAPASTVPGIYPEASERILTQDDLENRAVAELKMIRNEIFARHSYIFTSQEMKKYFEEQSWYKGLEKNVYPLLNQIEKKNLAFIIQREKELGKK